MSKKYKDYIYVISAVAAAVITAVMAVFDPFYAADQRVLQGMTGMIQVILIRLQLVCSMNIVAQGVEKRSGDNMLII